MSDYYSFFVRAKIDSIESSLHPLHDFWEILPPLKFRLGFGSVREVDVELPGIFEGVKRIKGFPYLMIIWPTLQEDNDFLARRVTFKVVLEWFDLRHYK